MVTRKRKLIMDLVNELPDIERKYILLRLARVPRWRIHKESSISFVEMRMIEKSGWDKIRIGLEHEKLVFKINQVLKQNANKSGMTLIELMMVITILGVISALGSIGYHKMIESATHRQEVMYGSVCRTAAYMSGSYKTSRERSTDILTKSDIEHWIKGGWNALAIDGEYPNVPQLTADDYFFKTHEEIAALMYD